MTRFLAIDLGDRRTGLATGDDNTRLVSPLAVLEIPPGPELVKAILRSAEDYGADALVIGLPLNMDGTEGPRVKIVRTFCASLAAQTALPIHEQDERLSSYAAEGRLAQSGRTHGQKKRIRDAMAAAEILGDFLGRG